jgi:nitroreductase
VLCARDSIDESYVESYIQDTAATRGIDPAVLDGYKHMMIGFTQPLTTEATKIWTDKQAYIPLGILVTAVAQMQIDACPMEGFDRAAYDKLLGLEGTGYHSVVIVPVGYRSADDKSAQYAKVRRSAQQVIEYYR